MIFSVIRTLISGGHVDLWSLLAQVLSVLFVIFCILPLHEFAHGWAANKLGDPTAKLEGRLTMNPLASLDPMGAFLLMFVGFGWAKPVPVDPRYFKKPKRDMALTALAGPASNLLAALVGAVIAVAIQVFTFYHAEDNFFYTVLYFFYTMLYYYVIVNISLAVFNLLPIPPLDGSRIAGAFLSDRALSAYYRNQNLLSMLLVILLVSGALSGPLYAVQRFFARGIFLAAELPFRLFGAL